MATIGTWKQYGGQLGLQPCQQASTTQNHPLGTRATFRDDAYGSAEFIYLKGVAGTTVGSWACYFEDDHSTNLVEGGGAYGGPVAVAMSACGAGEFGWYQITGKALGLCAADYSDNGPVYATVTPGVIDDAVVSGDKVSGARGASNRDFDNGLAEFEIQYPHYPSAYAVQPIVDNSGAPTPPNGAIDPVATVDLIVDQSGGVDPGDDTIAVVTQLANAGSADIAPTTAAIAQLAAKVNDNRDSVRTLTDAVAELAAKVNQIIDNQ